jgi:hypothetical protein
LHYADLGYRVIPLHGFINGACTCCQNPCPGGSKPGKHPACSHGHLDGSKDNATIQAWFQGKPWLNVGIALDENMLGLDIDPGKGGTESLKTWEQDHGQLPITPTVKTGSEGYHHYFILPPGITVKNKAGWVPGIDSRSFGGYLVAPPSLHQCGGHYEWHLPLTTPLAMAPDWLISIVGERDITPAMTTSKVGIPTIGRFVVVDEGPVTFSEHPGAPEGKRNQELCRLTGIHLSRGDTLASIEAMATSWAQRCNPPCEIDVVLSKVRALAKTDFAKKGRIGLDHNSTLEFQSNPIRQSNAQKDGLEVANALNPSSSSSPLPLTVMRQAEPMEEEWPEIEPEAYYGIAGDIIKAIAPETEADPAGILLSLLTAFGSAIGKGPHFALASGIHHANIFSGIVGDTASGKGQCWGIVQAKGWLIE